MSDPSFDKANKFVQRFASRAGNRQSLMSEFAVLSGSDVAENFRQGGRPSRWKKSQRAASAGGQTLIDTSRLMKSAIVPRVESDKIIYGSNLPYARVHQYGIDEDVKVKSFKRKDGSTVESFSRRMKITARPYLVFSKEFFKTAARIGARWLIEGI